MDPVGGQEQEEWKKTSMKGIPQTEQFFGKASILT
jgi:hypothetical protein